jgi:hypothetical protein
VGAFFVVPAHRAILKSPPQGTREEFLTADGTGFTQIIYEK